MAILGARLMNMDANSSSFYYEHIQRNGKSAYVSENSICGSLRMYLDRHKELMLILLAIRDSKTTFVRIFRSRHRSFWKRLL